MSVTAAFLLGGAILFSVLMIGCFIHDLIEQKHRFELEKLRILNGVVCEPVPAKQEVNFR